MTGIPWPELLAALVAGLMASLHCIGMCGPLAGIGCRAGVARGWALGPSLFVIGKLLSYSVLGFLAGMVGAALVRSGVLGRTTAWISLGGGVLMLLVLILGRLKIASTAGGLSMTLARLSLKAGKKAPLFLGMAAALLPCGLLYAMVARSAAAGEPVQSMVIMQAFGIGTSPALLGVGALMRAIPQKWSKYGAVAGEIVIAISALVLIWRGYHALMMPAAPACCH